MSRDAREMINKIMGRGKEAKQKYKSIGARNLMEGISMNAFSIKRTNDPNAQTVYFGADDDTFGEEVDFEFDRKGGIIVFSVNPNAMKVSDNKLIDRIRNNIETLKSTGLNDHKISTVLDRHEDVYGVTIGNFVKGRYKSEEELLYDKRSLSFEIIGISTDVLYRVAKDLAKEFNQETVLVKNYEDNRIYLVK